MRNLIQENRPLLALMACLLAASACARAGKDSAARRDTGASEGAPNMVPSAKAPGKSSDLSDADIRRAVIDELFRGPHTRAGAIIVACVNGVVELTGTVDNLLAKDRAVAIAEEVKGTRAVSDRIRIEPVHRADADLVKDVENALLYDPAAESYQVKVSATDGVVRLRGAVDSWQERRLAERLARGVSGVRAVTNDIRVNVFKARTDSEIERDVESRLRWDSHVNDGLINVEVHDGAVRLSGVVGSAAEKSEAYYDAWVRGARAVESSDLQVEWWTRDEDLRKDKYARKTDAQITSAVEDALRYDPRVNAFNVLVQVTDGVVTMSGNVSSVKAKLAAESLAEHTVGVTGVQNQLAVKPSKPIADALLTEHIRAAFAANPVLDASAIQVQVSNGKVTLTGVVPTQFESAEAADGANGMQGVTSVSNQLKVKAPELAFVWRSHVYPFGPYVEGWRSTASQPAQSDAAIVRNIQREFEWSSVVDPKQVHVEVHDGKATLSGTVNDARERQAAEENAFEGGAIAVDNQLKIG